MPRPRWQSKPPANWPALLALWLALGGGAAAASGAADDLLRQLDQAQVRSPNEKDVRLARNGVEEAIHNLQRTRANTDAESLDWLGIPPDPQASLAPILGDDSSLDGIEERLAQDFEPYERVEFQQLRSSIQLCRRTVRVAGKADLAREFQRRREAVRRLLEQLGSAPDRQSHRRLGQELLWLQEHGQMEDVVAQIREAFSHPNFMVRVSADFLEDLSRRSLSRSEPLARVSGRMTTTGQTRVRGSVQLAPRSDLRAPLELTFLGDLVLTAASRRGRVQFSTWAKTDVQSRLSLHLAEDGLRGATAPDTSASTCLVNGPTHMDRCGLASRSLARLADKAIARRAPAVANELSKAASQRIGEELSRTAEQELGQINDQYRRRILAPAIRLQLKPRVWRTAADATHLAFRLTEDRHCGLAAHVPFAHAVDAPAQAAIHETFATDVLNALFRGRNWPAEIDANSLQVLNDRLPVELFDVKGFRHDLHLRLDLHPRQPFLLAFSPSRATVTLCLERVVLDGDELHDARLAFSYRVLPSREGNVLELAGPPDLSIAPGRETPAQTIERFRRATHRELLSALKQRVVFDGLLWEGRTSSVELAQVALSDGWLALTARLASLPDGKSKGGSP